MRHPGLVAEDAAAGDAARRIDGEHGNLVPAVDQQSPQSVDQRALADTRHAGDTDPDGATGQRQQPTEKLLSESGILCPTTLHQGDRLRQSAPVSGHDALDEGVQIQVVSRCGHRPPADRPSRIPSRSVAISVTIEPGPKIAATPILSRLS